MMIALDIQRVVVPLLVPLDTKTTAKGFQEGGQIPSAHNHLEVHWAKINIYWSFRALKYIRSTNNASIDVYNWIQGLMLQVELSALHHVL